jgi:hypothetical protein
LAFSRTNSTTTSGTAAVGLELSAHGNKVGQPASLQVGLDHSAKFGLAGALMHKDKQLDHDAAGAPLAADLLS